MDHTYHLLAGKEDSRGRIQRLRRSGYAGKSAAALQKVATLREGVKLRAVRGTRMTTAKGTLSRQSSMGRMSSSALASIEIGTSVLMMLWKLS